MNISTDEGRQDDSIHGITAACQKVCKKSDIDDQLKGAKVEDSSHEDMEVVKHNVQTEEVRSQMIPDDLVEVMEKLVHDEVTPVSKKDDDDEFLALLEKGDEASSKSQKKRKMSASMPTRWSKRKKNLESDLTSLKENNKDTDL